MSPNVIFCGRVSSGMRALKRWTLRKASQRGLVVRWFGVAANVACGVGRASGARWGDVPRVDWSEDQTRLLFEE
jgi:hypothetical protein